MIARLIGIALATTLLLVGCAGTGPQPYLEVEKSGSGELRTDTAPLTDRFPALAGLESATWMSGTLGSDRAPGPSTYWIDAVVVLTPPDFNTLSDLFELQPASSAPAVHADLRALVPDGEWLTAAALDAEFSNDEYQSTVYLSPDHHSLVLVTIFQ